MSKDMEEIIASYYKHDAKKLHQMVDRVLYNCKFKDIDHEDFYSLASLVFVKDVLKNYDENQDFDGFLYSCLAKKFITEMTRRKRIKRQADFYAVSLDAPVDSEDNEKLTLGDIVPDTTTPEKNFFEEKEDGYSSKMLLYLSKLSKVQKEILRLTIAGYLPSEIREELHINEKQYNDNCAAIHSYRNVSVLF